MKAKRRTRLEPLGHVGKFQPDRAPVTSEVPKCEEGRRLPTVDFNLPRCHQCESEQLRVNRTSRDGEGIVLRYMKCLNCGGVFIARFS